VHRLETSTPPPPYALFRPSLPLQIKARYVRCREDRPTTPYVWSKYLSGKLMLVRWPNEKVRHFRPTVNQSPSTSLNIYEKLEYG
jgi:hypothetical protein